MKNAIVSSSCAYKRLQLTAIIIIIIITRSNGGHRPAKQSIRLDSLLPSNECYLLPFIFCCIRNCPRSRHHFQFRWSFVTYFFNRTRTSINLTF